MSRTFGGPVCDDAASFGRESISLPVALAGDRKLEHGPVSSDWSSPGYFATN
jgi:hypothetical protein